MAPDELPHAYARIAIQGDEDFERISSSHRHLEFDWDKMYVPLCACARARASFVNAVREAPQVLAFCVRVRVSVRVCLYGLFVCVCV